MRVLALDPGNTTGFALWEDGELLVADQAEAQEVEDRLYEQMRYSRRRPDAIVIEAFLITQATLRVSRQPQALYTIGVARFLARRYGVPLTMQTAADAKRFSSDRKLRVLGWYTPTTGGHANDALRHLLLWLVKNGKLKAEEALYEG